MRRASVSVAATIAEGFGRFNEMSQSSAEELRHYLYRLRETVLGDSPS